MTGYLILYIAGGVLRRFDSKAKSIKEALAEFEDSGRNPDDIVSITILED